MKTDNIYMVYRCKGCTRIVTKVQIIEMMTTGKLCPCASGQVTPCNLSGLDWLLPRVWKLVLWELLGYLAPSPEPSNRPVNVEPMRPSAGASA